MGKTQSVELVQLKKICFTLHVHKYMPNAIDLGFYKSVLFKFTMKMCATKQVSGPVRVLGLFVLGRILKGWLDCLPTQEKYKLFIY